MKVLSLFDGISCGMVALERANIPVERYVAYEIDENAIKVSMRNYPQIEHCGDVTTADFTQYKGFDLLIGGSPCQDLCSMGSHKGLAGEKSGLFFEFARALKEVNPKCFLLENNASMTKENEETITKIMGVEPIMINSADFTAQHRKRLYWTNIPVEEWEIKNVLLFDIAQSIGEKREFLITEKVNKYLSEEYKGRKIQKTVSASIRKLCEKSRCLSTRSCDVGSNSGLCLFQNGEYYVATPVECERLQTLPDNYTFGISNPQRYKCIGNGWTVDVIAHILKGVLNNG
jgi:DNA (cytosine-5)-methyltransferase 3A